VTADEVEEEIANAKEVFALAGLWPNCFLTKPTDAIPAG
jgi:hypothetical protein